MQPSSVVAAIAEALERADPSVTFGRLSTHDHGLVAAFGDATGYVITVRQAFDFAADDIAEPPEEGPAIEVEWDVLVIADPGVETVVTGADIHLLVNGVPRVVESRGTGGPGEN